MADQPTTVALAIYSEALDEIYALRRALAYEAQVLDAQLLDLRALGKGRRRILDQASERMRDAARGRVTVAYSGTSSRSLASALERAGIPDCLTRIQWETEPARRPRFIQ